MPKWPKKTMLAAFKLQRDPNNIDFAVFISLCFYFFYVIYQKQKTMFDCFSKQ